jgi:organic radical activating enzyme
MTRRRGRCTSVGKTAAFRVAEKFVSPQGEGMYAGTVMAFIRFVGCSVGKRICQHCDTDFDKEYQWLGGGEFDIDVLTEWVKSSAVRHVCFTGGEPLDQDLAALVGRLSLNERLEKIHVETSGTVDLPDWARNQELMHLTCCPKPGWIEDQMTSYDEIKVIVGGLGTPESLESMKAFEGFAVESPKNHPLADRATFRWPSLEDALRWAKHTPVYLQPRNKKYEVDANNLKLAQELVLAHPQLRLSTQLHKLLQVR